MINYADRDMINHENKKKELETLKKTIGLVLLIFLGFTVSALASAGKPAADDDYVIGQGDMLDISVWGDQALTKTVVVLPDGNISYFLIGIVKAAGKTVPQLKKEIETRISSYVPNPVLNVEVRQVNSMLIYVIGRVNAPGKFVIYSNVNVLQALSMAGGLNAFAKRDKIKIFREEDGQTKIFNFRYDDVVDGNMLEQNIKLQRGDVLVAP